MGVYNVVHTVWECPFCHVRQTTGIQTKYGDMSTIHNYRIGDRMEVPERGYHYRPRLPNGTGIVFGFTSCVNVWDYRKCPNPWDFRKQPLSEIGLWTPDKLEYGCPDSLKHCIELKEDVIMDVRFPDAIKDIISDTE